MAWVVDSIDWFKLFLIVGISAVSVIIRWWSFSRVDSVALELSLNSFFLKLFETCTDIFVNDSFSLCAVLLCALLFLFVVILATVHHWMKNKLNKIVQDIIEEAKQTSKESSDFEETRKNVLDSTMPLARHAIFLSFSAFLEQRLPVTVRKGKSDARKRYAQLIDSISDAGNVVKENDLLLPEKKQILGLVLFLLLGAGSVLIAVLS